MHRDARRARPLLPPGAPAVLGVFALLINTFAWVAFMHSRNDYYHPCYYNSNKGEPYENDLLRRLRLERSKALLELKMETLDELLKH